MHVRAQIGSEYFHPINGASAAKYERRRVFRGGAGSPLYGVKCQRTFVAVQSVSIWSVKNERAKIVKKFLTYSSLYLVLTLDCDRNNFLFCNLLFIVIICSSIFHR